MIIILEGPDGGGKDTVIKTILKQYPTATCYHFGIPRSGEDQLLRYAIPLLEHRRGDTLIFNRSWYSEFVYGPIMRNQSELQPRDSTLLDNIAISKDICRIIYAYADPDILWHRCKAKGEDYVTNREVLNLISAYYQHIMDTLPSSFIPITWLDTEFYRVSAVYDSNVTFY